MFHSGRKEIPLERGRGRLLVLARLYFWCRTSETEQNLFVILPEETDLDFTGA